MCYIILGIENDIHFEQTEHIRGVDNVICDKLSRQHTPEELGFNPEEIVCVDGALSRLLDACNPLNVNSTLGGKDFERAWAEAYSISKELQESNR